MKAVERGENALGQQAFPPARLPRDRALQFLVTVQRVFRDDPLARLHPHEIVFEEPAFFRDVPELVAEHEHAPEAEDDFTLGLEILDDDKKRAFLEDLRVAALLDHQFSLHHEIGGMRRDINPIPQLDHDDRDHEGHDWDQELD